MYFILAGFILVLEWWLGNQKKILYRKKVWQDYKHFIIELIRIQKFDKPTRQNRAKKYIDGIQSIDPMNTRYIY